MTTYTKSLISLMFATLVATSAQAQPLATPAADMQVPVLTINSQAKAVVPNDEMQITVRIRQVGFSSNEGNEYVSKMGTEAMSALKAAGIQLTAFSSTQYPEYSNTKLLKTKWTSEGRFTAKASNPADIQKMISVVNKLATKYPDVYVLQTSMTTSDKAFDAVKAQLTQDVATQFKQDALSVAKAMGYSNYQVKEISFQDGFGRGGGVPVMMMMKASAAPEADVVSAPVATEAEASASMSGQVYLIK